MSTKKCVKQIGGKLRSSPVKDKSRAENRETHHVLGSNSTVPDASSPQANMNLYDDCVKSDLPPTTGIRKADSKQEHSGKLWKKKSTLDKRYEQSVQKRKKKQTNKIKQKMSLMYLNSWPILLILTEWIITVLKYKCSPIWLAKLKTFDSTFCEWGCGETGILIIVGSSKWSTLYGK